MPITRVTTLTASLRDRDPDAGLRPRHRLEGSSSNAGSSSSLLTTQSRSAGKKRRRKSVSISLEENESDDEASKPTKKRTRRKSAAKSAKAPRRSSSRIASAAPASSSATRRGKRKTSSTTSQSARKRKSKPVPPKKNISKSKSARKPRRSSSSVLFSEPQSKASSGAEEYNKVEPSKLNFSDESEDSRATRSTLRRRSTLKAALRSTDDSTGLRPRHRREIASTSPSPARRRKTKSPGKSALPSVAAPDNDEDDQVKTPEETLRGNRRRPLLSKTPVKRRAVDKNARGARKKAAADAQLRYEREVAALELAEKRKRGIFAIIAIGLLAVIVAVFLRHDPSSRAPTSISVVEKQDAIPCTSDDDEENDAIETVILPDQNEQGDNEMEENENGVLPMYRALIDRLFDEMAQKEMLSIGPALEKLSACGEKEQQWDAETVSKFVQDEKLASLRSRAGAFLLTFEKQTMFFEKALDTSAKGESCGDDECVVILHDLALEAKRVLAVQSARMRTFVEEVLHDSETNPRRPLNTIVLARYFDGEALEKRATTEVAEYLSDDFEMNRIRRLNTTIFESMQEALKRIVEEKESRVRYKDDDKVWEPEGDYYDAAREPAPSEDIGHDAYDGNAETRDDDEAEENEYAIEDNGSVDPYADEGSEAERDYYEASAPEVEVEARDVGGKDDAIIAKEAKSSEDEEQQHSSTHMDDRDERSGADEDDVPLDSAEDHAKSSEEQEEEEEDSNIDEAVVNEEDGEREVNVPLDGAEDQTVSSEDQEEEEEDSNIDEAVVDDPHADGASASSPEDGEGEVQTPSREEQEEDGDSFIDEAVVNDPHADEESESSPDDTEKVSYPDGNVPDLPNVDLDGEIVISTFPHSLTIIHDETFTSSTYSEDLSSRSDEELLSSALDALKTFSSSFVSRFSAVSKDIAGNVAWLLMPSKYSSFRRRQHNERFFSGPGSAFENSARGSLWCFPGNRGRISLYMSSPKSAKGIAYQRVVGGNASDAMPRRFRLVGMNLDANCKQPLGVQLARGLVFGQNEQGEDRRYSFRLPSIATPSALKFASEYVRRLIAPLNIGPALERGHAAVSNAFSAASEAAGYASSSCENEKVTLANLTYLGGEMQVAFVDEDLQRSRFQVLAVHVEENYGNVALSCIAGGGIKILGVND